MPRNTSGVYTLPSGNPVVSGTLIESVWANSTLSDVAAAITSSLDRNGNGAMLAVLKGTDGTAVAPSFTFSAESSTGMFRAGAGQLGFTILGVARMALTAAGLAVTGNLSATGGLTFTGGLTIGGDATIAGRGLFANGTAPLPSVTFTGDPTTGMYLPAVNALGFSTVGALRVQIDGNGSMTVFPTTNPGAPCMALQAAAGGFGLDIRGRVSDNLGVIRFLNNAGSAQSATLQYDDSNGLVIGTTQSKSLQFTVNNNVRLIFDPPTGNATFLGAQVVAPNFYVGTTAAAAGTFGVSGGLGGSIVTWGNTAPGAGVVDFYASAQPQAQIQNSGGGTVVNFHVLAGGLAGNRVQFIAAGTDTNIGIQWAAKGSGDYAFFGGAPVGGLHLQLNGSGPTWVQIAGAQGVAPNFPVITSNAPKISVPVAMRFVGSLATAGDLASTYSQASAVAYSFVDNTRSPGSKVAEHVFTGGGFQARFLNDAGNDARTIWASNGGVGANGIANTLLYTGNNDLTMFLNSAGPGGGQGRVCIGSQVPYTQLEVQGIGQFGLPIFDPDAAPTQMGSTILLADVGNNGGNGGVIMFGGFSTSAPGKHFASIRGYITDASANTAGELRFNTKNTSADTGSTQALRLTASKQILDSRDLSLGRDPGATAGSTPPVGSLIIATVGAVSVAALATVVASTNNLTIQGTSAGANAVINAGTWRNCGARDAGVGHAFWLRIA